MVVEVTLTQDEITRALAQIEAHLSDMTPLMQDIGDLLQNSTTERFGEGKDPDGNAWAPKSQATIARQRKGEAKGANASIDFRPLFGPSRRLSSEIHYQADAKSVEIGSSLIYAAVQQFGATKGQFGTMANGAPVPWGDIPARPFLGISEDDKNGIIQTITEYLTEATGGGA